MTITTADARSALMCDVSGDALRYDPWRHLAESFPWVKVETGKLRSGRMGEWRSIDVIVLAYYLGPDEARSTLAHELVHVERGPSPKDPDLAAAEEKVVDEIAARRLIGSGNRGTAVGSELLRPPFVFGRWYRIVVIGGDRGPGVEVHQAAIPPSSWTRPASRAAAPPRRQSKRAAAMSWPIPGPPVVPNRCTATAANRSGSGSRWWSRQRQSNGSVWWPQAVGIIRLAAARRRCQRSRCSVGSTMFVHSSEVVGGTSPPVGVGSAAGGFCARRRRQR